MSDTKNEDTRTYDNMYYTDKLIIESDVIKATSPQLLLAYISGLTRGAMIANVLLPIAIGHFWFNKEVIDRPSETWYTIDMEVIDYLQSVAQVPFREE
jgi:hypothetical protein